MCSLQCMSIILDNSLSHPLMEKLLPALKCSLHDSSEKVRVAFVGMLLKIKGVRAAKVKDWTSQAVSFSTKSRSLFDLNKHVYIYIYIMLANLIFFSSCVIVKVLESLLPGTPAGSFGDRLASRLQANCQSPLQLILSSKPTWDCLVWALCHPDPDKSRSSSQVLPIRLSVHRSC